MFDFVHTIYLIATIVSVSILLFLCTLIKNQRAKDCILKVFALAALFLHWSPLWVEFVQKGSATVGRTMLFPIYFCNLMMWLMVITAFKEHKKGKLFQWIATYAAYGGFVGSAVTLLYPQFYIDHPVLDWNNLKSMIDHACILFCSLFLLTGGYIKIRVRNVFPITAGLLFTGLVGIANIALFRALGLKVPNSMYLLEPAVDGVNFLMGYYIAPCILAGSFLFSAVWEAFACKKGRRWYNKRRMQFRFSAPIWDEE